MLKQAFFKLHKAVFDSYIWLPASLSGALLEMLNHPGLKGMKFGACIHQNWGKGNASSDCDSLKKLLKFYVQAIICGRIGS